MEPEKPLILVAEDEAMNREILRRFLDRLGYGCVSAENGREAVDLLLSSHASLVLLDISMPVMDGIAALKRMKEEASIKAVPVVMVSAVNDMETIARCIELGADDYLIKPFNPWLLGARIRNSLARFRARETEERLVRELEGNLRALKETEAMRDLLSHMIVHDINNPLTALSGYAVLCGELASDDRMREYLKRIQYAADEITGLSQDLLEVAKMENANLKIRLERFDPSDTIRLMCDYYRAAAEWSKASLDFSLPQPAVTVSADKGLFGRVMQNLITNAIKHSDGGGSIRVEASGSGEKAVFSVADRGFGVPDEYKGRVFDKFFQIKSRQKKEKFGFGLGLAFCKMAVEAQQGRIWVEDNPGGGAVFRFSLPAGA